MGGVSPALDGLPCKGEQLLKFEGLGDVVESPPFHGLYRRLDVPVTGDHDHGHGWNAVLDVDEHFHAIHSWKANVEQDQVEFLRTQSLQAFFTVFGRYHLKAFQGELALDEIPDMALVIDCQDFRRMHRWISLIHLREHCMEPARESAPRAHSLPHDSLENALAAVGLAVDELQVLFEKSEHFPIEPLRGAPESFQQSFRKAGDGCQRIVDFVGYAGQKRILREPFGFADDQENFLEPARRRKNRGQGPLQLTGRLAWPHER